MKSDEGMHFDEADQAWILGDHDALWGWNVTLSEQWKPGVLRLLAWRTTADGAEHRTIFASGSLDADTGKPMFYRPTNMAWIRIPVTIDGSTRLVTAQIYLDGKPLAMPDRSPPGFPLWDLIVVAASDGDRVEVSGPDKAGKRVLLVYENEWRNAAVFTPTGDSTTAELDALRARAEAAERDRDIVMFAMVRSWSDLPETTAIAHAGALIRMWMMGSSDHVRVGLAVRKAAGLDMPAIPSASGVVEQPRPTNDGATATWMDDTASGWVRIPVTIDGSTRNIPARIYLDGKPVAMPDRPPPGVPLWDLMVVASAPEHCIEAFEPEKAGKRVLLVLEHEWWKAAVVSPQAPGAVDQPRPTNDGAAATWEAVITRATNIARQRQDKPTDPVPPYMMALIEDMKARHAVGVERYGVALGPHNGRDSMVDLYQEVLDSCVYAENLAIETGDSTWARSMAARMLYVAVEIRRKLYDRDAK